MHKTRTTGLVSRVVPILGFKALLRAFYRGATALAKCWALNNHYILCINNQCTTIKKQTIIPSQLIEIKNTINNHMIRHDTDHMKIKVIESMETVDENEM